MIQYPFATNEQKDLAAMARSILEKELKPRIAELEEQNHGLGGYPMDVHRKLVEAGFYGMNIPEAYGGVGLDNTTIAMILEEMASVDAGFTFSFYCAGSYYAQILQTKMPEEQKQAWITDILEGKKIGCLCITESGAGSDVSAMRTTAVQDGDEWVINGTKSFITNATLADYFVVAAWTDKTKRASEGVTCFLVERDFGVKTGKKENKLGFKLSETGDVVFEDVRVPADHIVGEVGRGFAAAMGRVDESRSMHAAYALGISQAALDASVEYAKVRRTFGKREIDHQAMGHMIADMQARIDGVRAVLYQVMGMLDQGMKVGRYCHVLKLLADDCVVRTTSDAIQVLGAYGYTKEYPVEKLYRDGRLYPIFGGTDQMLRKAICKTLAGRDPQRK